MTTFIHDPDAVLDYIWDWSAWLDSDTISTATTTADTGITIDSTTNTTTAVTVTLSGGTAGENYDVTVHITTAGGLEDDRTIRIQVRER